MIPTHRPFALLPLLLAAAGSAAAQQAPGAAPADPPSVTAIVNRARAAAGTDWTEAADFFCSGSARANRADDPEIAPTRVFDNLYAIGRTGTVVWAITTPAGIVLIDAGYPDQLEAVLLPGMRKLGLDPNDVKYVLVGHGHADHFGGASYFQQRGARVVLSAADWALVENPAPPPGGNAPAPAAAAPTGTPRAAGAPPAAPALPPPKRDVVAEEGHAIEFGGVKITPVLIPGHTPGSLGFVFDVADGGRRHTAALFGGSILLVSRIPTDGLEQYVRSVEHFADVTKSLGVDVEIQNHPLYDGFVGKLERLGARVPADRHPFVVGPDAYQRFLTVMADCTRAEIERRRTASGPR
jgi:metallo-beta-lactamase class B